MCLAVPGRIVSVDDDDEQLRMGVVDFGGITRDVSLIYVPEAGAGDYVVVHVGFALTVLDEDEAVKTLSYFKEIGEMEMDIGDNR